MRTGLIYAVIAYTIWGLLPLYWKWFENMPASEILSHRIVWSFVVVIGIVAIKKRWKELKMTLTVKETVLPLVFSSLLITANWLIFIWAVNNEQAVETSIGYYLTPLFNVVIAILFLREKPTGGQWLAIALAGTGVLLIAIDYGRLPWISISLALTFGLYGLVKKKVKIDAAIGLVTETMIVMPIAIIYWGYMRIAELDTAWSLPLPSILLLLLSGVATATPLLLFANAARRLPLSMLGFVQYIGPTLTLIISVFIFKEVVSPVMLVSLTLIWTALVVYAVSSIRAAKAQRFVEVK
ncbi:EamA family transporter RarD [Paenibacillus sp. GSMTC-2017]|uniref:EamA family transporter RarD n=1 Tax=Paenibacillus sp. GSMTC-2017 TaxID=2794350 RepID=UPI0018D5C6C3|nr:EamA family transporter RarD [Paenibacillus sp. GSMTC-2017]MBH5316250.1 EamA family transporter RarD [Paenibacillus sp. GSMTC-2017]